MAKKLIYKNAYERYEIEDEIFDFYEAPFYKESEHNYKEKEAETLIEKILNEDLDESILNNYLIEIAENTFKLTSKPKLYKIKIGNKVFADVFYDFKILISELEENTVITIYFNYHGFDGNETSLDQCFYVEHCYQELETATADCNNYLFSPNGDILAEEIDLEEILKYID